MAAGNPFYDIHEALWDMLEDTDCATDLVTAGKHFTDLVATPERRVLTDADVWDYFRAEGVVAGVPECAVVQVSVRAGDRALDCVGTAVDVHYEVLIRTGEHTADTFWDLQWATLRQCMNWEAYFGRDDDGDPIMSWLDESSYVWNVDLFDTKDSLVMQILGKDTNGWSCAWKAEVRCVFQPSSLIA